jgi:hypothetical protein
MFTTTTGSMHNSAPTVRPSMRHKFNAISKQGWVTQRIHVKKIEEYMKPAIREMAKQFIGTPETD